jgi:beta-glucanase (GH16 family)
MTAHLNAPVATLDEVQTQLLWEQHFRGPQGPAPTVAYTDGRTANPSTPLEWQPDIGDGADGPGVGWGNNESEYYTDDAIALDGSDDGALVITAARTNATNGPQGWQDRPDWAYVSGKITTAGRLSFQYGLLQARIKPPTDLGSWSAFWLLGDGLLSGTPWPQCGEIDVLESVGQEPRHLLGTIHGPGYSADGGVTCKIEHSAPLSEDFHEFAILWLPDSITWYFDGVAYHHLTPADIPGKEWVFNQPFYAIINLAMGGTLGGTLHAEVEQCQLYVDYVRHSAVQIEPDAAFIGEVIRH